MPEAWPGPLLSENVKGAVPPVVIAVAVPFVPPKQVIGVEVMAAVTDPELATVVEGEMMQPFASVIAIV